MKSQQQAEKEEQQRVKNFVLNLDLRENEDQDGEDSSTPLMPDHNIDQVKAGNEKTNSYHHNRADARSYKDRSQRSRKLQISDVDWYDKSKYQSPPSNSLQAAAGQEKEFSRE